jgi:N-acetylglucosaminyldiphosphoundecaprenol N-acetyl-beta-D-mannosaminyltransferase
MYATTLPHRYILGTRVDATSYADATNTILDWARARQSRYVCAANVHMVMESYDDIQFRRVVNSADMVTADGLPLVWTLNRSGIAGATRVYGPDLMLRVCGAAEQQGLPVGFYGGAPEHMNDLIAFVLDRFPKLKVVFSCSPPTRDLTSGEDENMVHQINASEARIVFVSLEGPGQECWMKAHKGRVRAVMLGVGTAFDFYSGRLRQAPFRARRAGLAWFHRLIRDPKGLWRRHIYHNPRFVWLMGAQRLGRWRSPR